MAEIDKISHFYNTEPECREFVRKLILEMKFQTIYEAMGEPFSLVHYAVSVVLGRKYSTEEARAEDVVTFNPELLSRADELNEVFGLKPVSYEYFCRKRVFVELTQEWEKETGLISDADKIVSHKAYRAIISLGCSVVPLILSDLKTSEPKHWFTALSELTGENPVPLGDYGDMKAMANYWINWGYQKGIIS